MRPNHALVTILLGLLPSAMAGQTQANCTFLTFTAPPGSALLEVNGISPSNTIVGGLENSSTLHNSGFIRDASGRFTSYDAPNSFSTNFTGRNETGADVGTFNDASTSSYRGFVLQGSHFKAVDHPGATNTFLNGINKSGDMVGNFVSPSLNAAFEFAGGQFHLLQFPGALNTSARGINDRGVIVGEYDLDGVIQYGFILRGGNYQTVDDPDQNNAFGTRLLGVNSAGEVVGEFEDSQALFHGFIYKDGVFENVVYPKSRNTFVDGINNAGIITGLAFGQDGSTKGYAATCH